MTQPSAAASILVASRDALVAMPLQLATGAHQSEHPGEHANALLNDAVALCIEADIALIAMLAAARPHEPADVIIANYHRRWKRKLIAWSLGGPLAIVGLILLGVVIATLVTAFIWRP